MEIIFIERLKKARKYIRMGILLALLACVLFLIGFGLLFTYAKVAGPPPLSVPQTVTFYAQDGSVIGEMSHGEKRYWVPLKNISPFLTAATVSIEDQHFYQHHGFDGKRIGGAIVADIKAGAKVQGASTITQQYARNLFLGHDKTWERKIVEALYTVRLETNYTKAQILEGYLNTIYYGHGAYGVEAASRFYFGKSAKDLTLAEASILAGIPKGPSYYSPMDHLENAKSRQKLILRAMVRNHKISQKEALSAQTVALSFGTKPYIEKEQLAPYFVDSAKAQLINELKIDPDMIKTKGLKVYTTLNPSLQKIAEETVRSTIADYSDIQIALTAINPNNGQVQALVGGRDYEQSSFNRATQAVRQPGSTMKPFLYYAALKEGFTPSTEMKSEPTTFTMADGVSKYTPSNYNNYYADGPITLAQAIALSDNVYAVKTDMFIGEKKLIETAKLLGISTPLKEVPSLALGTSGVKQVEMANAYGILANGGKEVKPSFIQRIETYDGQTVYEEPIQQKQLLDPKVAFVTNQLMTGMFDPKLNDYTSVTGTPILKQLSHDYSGKSGTTLTDSWMIGSSPELTTAVWSGYDDNREMTSPPERKYTKEIWATFMEKALRNQGASSFSTPKGVVGVLVNPDNGKLATSTCPVARLTYYVKGTEPTEYCTEHLHHKKVKKVKPAPQKHWYNSLWDWVR
ncbi:transglycosylase domain-containing protein [Priestia koreensis]|uniref:transglycosylase domain-containing protein n=1 Tax=Priestia koreensis TaxID=284581 RepID=UPI003457490C